MATKFTDQQIQQALVDLTDAEKCRDVPAFDIITCLIDQRDQFAAAFNKACDERNLFARMIARYHHELEERGKNPNEALKAAAFHVDFLIEALDDLRKLPISPALSQAAAKLRNRCNKFRTDAAATLRVKPDLTLT